MQAIPILRPSRPTTLLLKDGNLIETHAEDLIEVEEDIGELRWLLLVNATRPTVRPSKVAPVDIYRRRIAQGESIKNYIVVTCDFFQSRSKTVRLAP